MDLFTLTLPLLLAAGDRPFLVVRASPPLVVAPLGTGCAVIVVTAEIRGPEMEGWYCPRVEWRWPGGTTSMVESDCPPFEARDRAGWHREGDEIVEEPAAGFPRRWTRSACLPPTPGEDPWEVEVRLSKGGKTIARESARVRVQ